MRQYAIENDIQDVVILGDLFHDRVSINIEVLHAVHAFFDDPASRRLHWWAFPGNHDMFLKNSWDIHSLQPLKGLVNIIPDVRKLEIGGTSFWIIPFIYDESSYMKVLKAIEDRAAADDILLTHIGVNGAKLNECFLIRNWNIVNFNQSKFRLVLTGHFHCYQQVEPNVWYPGSPVAFRFDEGVVPHGFIVYDGDIKFVNIRDINPSTADGPPEYRTLVDEDADGKPDDFFLRNQVRIVLTRNYTRNELAKLDEAIRAKGAIGVSWLKPKEKDVEIDAARKGDIDMKSPEKLLDIWLKKDKPVDMDARLLFKLHDQITQEAEERVIVETEDT